MAPGSTVVVLYCTYILILLYRIGLLGTLKFMYVSRGVACVSTRKVTFVRVDVGGPLQ